MKKTLTALTSASLFTILCTSFCTVLSAKIKPNIVIVITDDQGYGDLGCTGNPVIKTPHMDALAAESSVLEDYHVSPTCSPSRASLLTGHWANRTGVWHTIMGRSMLRTNEKTIGTLLQQNGYRTGMFGKWHLGDNFPYRPEERGFDEVYRHAGGGVGQAPDHWDNAYFDGTYIHNGKKAPAKGFCTDVFFEAGNAFIKKCVKEKKPFFAYISTNAPHGPYHCPQKYMDMYKGQNKTVAAFFGMISNIDDNLGKTRSLLKELGVYENTIFIFTTDNGTSSGASVYNAGMKGAKASQYDGGHRVPFFLHWPAAGMNKHHEVKHITHAVDIVPTLLDLSDSEAPAQLKFDGRSIAPLLKLGKDIKWPERMLISDSQRVVDPIKWRKSAVMSDRWRLIDGVELYDMDQDPGQQNDEANKFPEQVKKMRDFYDAWWAELQPSYSQTTEISIGHPKIDKVTLTCHDWIGGEWAPPWSQAQVRWTGRLYGYSGKNVLKGDKRFDRHWAIYVETTGTYEISVMRWPEEANHPIRAALKAGDPVPGASKAYRSHHGKDIPAVKATLRIDGKDIASKKVEKNDTKITFTVELTNGSRKLAPYFTLDTGDEEGTYYAIITKK